MYPGGPESCAKYSSWGSPVLDMGSGVLSLAWGVTESLPDNTSQLPLICWCISYEGGLGGRVKRGFGVIDSWLALAGLPFSGQWGVL